MPNIDMNLKSYSASYFFQTNQYYLETKANERVQVSEPQPADRGVCPSLCLSQKARRVAIRTMMDRGINQARNTRQTTV